MYYSMAEVTSGRKELKNNTGNAMKDVFSFFHVNKNPEPFRGQDPDAYLHEAVRGVLVDFRRIMLTDEWYRNSHNPVLAFRQDGSPVALIPDTFGKYYYFDWQSGKKVRANASNAGNFKEEAFSFYRTLPEESLRVRDLLKFMFQCLRLADYMLFFMLTLAGMLLGMLTPAVTNLIFSQVIYMPGYRFLLPAFCVLVSAGISVFLINIIKSQVLSRISQNIEIQVRTAAFRRTLSFNVRFFRKYTPGDLSQRLSLIHLFCTTLAEGVLSTGLSFVLAVIYFFQIYAYAPALFPAALIIFLIMAVYTVLQLLAQKYMTTKLLKAQINEAGFLYSALSAIRKIRITGSEKRFMARWMEIFKNGAMAKYRPPFIVKYSQPLFLTISLAGALSIYVAAAGSQVSTSGFMAFMAAYGIITGTVNTLIGMMPQAAMIPSILDMIRPLLEEAPEKQFGSLRVDELKGEITISDVCFRYDENSRLILDGLNLKISPGEYLAIVGKSGCGKSTLMRLMLGFEEPVSGSVFYDGIDVSRMDRNSLRQHIGIVMQDSRLFIGDIYRNITIANPRLTMEDAWKAAEAAGIAEDIRNMPMQMHTLIGENSTSISGGQRQRILIARALAAQPKILIFDEATSALDNLTQKNVTDTLNSLSCTRVIIAHRLSTIRACDRIVMIDNGRIAEEGTYDELMAINGEFSRMVQRQQMLE